MTHTNEDNKIRRVLVPLSLKEASLISFLRRHEFGEFRIHKQGGEPTRIEIVGSYVVSEKEGLDIADSIVINPQIEDIILNKLITQLKTDEQTRSKA